MRRHSGAALTVYITGALSFVPSAVLLSMGAYQVRHGLEDAFTIVCMAVVWFAERRASA